MRKRGNNGCDYTGENKGTDEGREGTAEARRSGVSY